MSWYDDVQNIVDNYGRALDAFTNVFDGSVLPDELAHVQRKAHESNRDVYLELLSHFQSEWKQSNPDWHDYFVRIHRRMEIVTEKFIDGTNQKIVDARIITELGDEITLRDGTYIEKMRDRCQYVIRSLADVLQYTETPIPHEMQEFLRGIDSTPSGPEQK